MPTIVTIQRNEAPYLREWVAFHRLQGFDRFLVYDNHSTDGGDAIARLLGCEVVDWPGDYRPQLPAFMEAVNHRLPLDDWAAFIDSDEFIWCPSGARVVDWLAARREEAIAVPWLMFGDCGHEEPPSGLTIENYLTRGADTNPHHKQILKPGGVTFWPDPHTTNLPFYRPPTSEIAINHYWTRSVAECRAKFARGRPDYEVKREMWEFFEQREGLNAEFDDRLWSLWGERLLRAVA